MSAGQADELEALLAAREDDYRLGWHRTGKTTLLRALLSGAPTRSGS